MYPFPLYQSMNGHGDRSGSYNIFTIKATEAFWE